LIGLLVLGLHITILSPLCLDPVNAVLINQARFRQLTSHIDLIAPISDPEHPLSLESLGVVKLQDVHLISPPDLANPTALSRVLVELTPTVTHCSLATVIGLGVRVRLEQALPPSYRVEVKIKKDTHSQSEEVNKQLADKERVAAALENANLMGILRKMMEPCQD
jgi:metal-sulfur cluster biosynthetic enzyme